MVPGAERGFLVRELDPRKPFQARIRQVFLGLCLSPSLFSSLRWLLTVPAQFCLTAFHSIPPAGFDTAVLPRALQLSSLLYLLPQPHPVHTAGASGNILSRSQCARAPHFG